MMIKTQKQLLQKKKSMFILFIIVFSFFLIPLHQALPLSLTEDDQTGTITLSEATQIGESMLASHGKKNTHSLLAAKKIMDSSNDNLLAYQFPLLPTGYIIVTNSKDLPPILAYSFTNNPCNDGSSSNPFLSFIQHDLQNRYFYLEMISLEIKQHHQRQWHQLLRHDHAFNPLLVGEQWPPKGSTSTEGWIETTWHQNKPYKNFCPMDHTTGKRSIAGCPALAMAQILNYHQTINQVFFTDDDDYLHEYLETYIIDDDFETYDFPNFSTLNTYLENVSKHYDENIALTDDDKAALTFACGVGAEQVYSSKVSGTYGIDQIYQSYYKFNCTSARLLQEDTQALYQEVIDDIKQAQPVHLAVVDKDWQTGHNLIIDGYNTDGFYHLNFGYGGRYDGWYEIPDEIPFKLNIMEGVIVDIMDFIRTSDLITIGSITLPKVNAGVVINESFQVINNGTVGSRLNWHVKNVPDWGSWQITPSNGTGLTPEDGPVTISVQCTVPEQKWRQYHGGITLVNDDQPGDQSIISVSLRTSKQKQFLSSLFSMFYNHPLVSFLIEVFNNSI